MIFKILWKYIQRLLFSLDAELAHRLTVRLIQVASITGGAPLRLASGSSIRDRVPHTVWGIEFKNRLGLAAGFDKDCEIVKALPHLGFGFVEVGTVTPRPQPGNERPRLFRDLKAQSLFNRMGFNGAGAFEIAHRLSQCREKLPAGFRVGINLGKNKDTPAEKAASDYAKACQSFQGLVDYVVINVSSPNTPGLRALQSVDSLRPIVQETQNVISGWKNRPPLLIKLAPELSGSDLSGLIVALEALKIDGWVLTNTLAGDFLVGNQTLSGGWSGKILAEASHQSLVTVRSQSRLPIISVGGILNSKDALERVRLGADLIQVYTGWVLSGPRWIPEVVRSFSKKSSI